MSDRRWVTIVQLDVSWSTCIYGSAPCTAAIGVTGTQRCFNTVGTCQDRAHYQDGTATLTFCKNSGYQSLSGIPDLIPSLVDVDTTPGVVSLGEDLGQRASAKIVFRDHKHSDAGLGFDKYLSTRLYNPYDQGWFWAKFAARHPNIRGKKVRVYQGWVGQALEDMIVQNFVVDSVDGPTLDGRFTITAKDPLKSLDLERSQGPRVSAGVLTGAMTTGTTSVTLTPAGSGDGYYGTAGWVNVGGTEVCSYTRTLASDVLTLVRAQKNTVAVTHAAGDRVQVCLSYAAQDPAVIVKDLMVTYGGVDPALINMTDWLSETVTYNSQVYTGFITEPTGVKTLIAEIVQQAGLAVWWDEYSSQVRLQVLRAISTDTMVFDETTVTSGSMKITAQPDKRKSEIWTYFAQKNPLNGIQFDNLPGVAVRVDTDSEADFGSALIKTIKSRWVPSGGLLVAQRLNELQLGRYLSPPRKIEFSLPVDEDTSNIPVVGGGYQLSAPPVQAADGSRTAIAFSVTGIKIKDGVVSVVGEELNWTELRIDPFNRTISVDYNLYSQVMRTLHDNLYGTPQAGGTVTLRVSSTARIGSNNLLAALDTGTWPTVAVPTATRSTVSKTLTGIASTTAFVIGQAVTGAGIPNNSRVVSKTGSTVDIDQFPTSNGTGALTLYTTILKIQIDGYISGRGGVGGSGVGGDNHTGGTGGNGGIGLKAQAPVELIGGGTLQGGGGGGGGGGGDYRGWVGPQQNGGGGGGGGGEPAGGGGGSGGAGAAAGAAGALTGGGSGGHSNYSNFRGGNGGAPGVNGANAVGDFAGSRGTAGSASTGSTLIKQSAFTGAIHGAQT